MLRDLSSSRDTMLVSQGRLDTHFADLLGCEAAWLRRPGVVVVPTERRRRPDRQGQVQPVLGLAPTGSAAYVLSCLPELAPLLEQALAALPAGSLPFDPSWLEGVSSVTAATPEVVWGWRRVYVADPAHFRPHGVDPSIKIERIEPGAEPDLWLSHAFDGPCYVIRTSSGSLVAWAGLRCTSEHAWEIEAVTEPAYRGRGLATALTAAATAHVLSDGRLALWVADIDNLLSQRLVERLGFRVYGEQLVARTADPMLAPPP